MELGPKRPSPLWFWGHNSIIVVYTDPLGIWNSPKRKSIVKEIMIGSPKKARFPRVQISSEVQPSGFRFKSSIRGHVPAV